MKKVVILFCLLMLIGGCSSNKLNINYDKMQVSKDGINGYSLDLRIYGKDSDRNINDSVRIENYNNTQYKITNFNGGTENSDDNNEEVTYVIDNKTYVADELGNYNVTKEAVKYSDPSIYLSGLQNISKISKTSKETIADNEYDVYDVVFSKKIIDQIMQDVELRDIGTTATGQIYIDNEGYIYRIIYHVGDVTINANYFGINMSRKIVLPEGESTGHLED